MKILKNKRLFKKVYVLIIVCLFVVLFSFLIVDGYLNLDMDVKIYVAGVKDMIDQRTGSLLFEINIFPQDLGDDLLFLSKLSSLHKIFDSTGEAKGKAIEKLEEDFLSYIKCSTAYYRLRYIDETGQEIVRVEFDGINYKVVSEDNLQNKAHRNYFSETVKLNERENYLSSLDLSVENGIIENRGSEEDSNYVPTIRASTPVFNNNELKGIVIFDIYANYFLDVIRQSQREGEGIFLIDKEGYYLAHPDREREFSFIFEKEYNFFNDYPEISKEILLDFNKRKFESENFIFSFRHISPTIENSRISNGDYSWILVSVSDKTELSSVVDNLKDSYLYFLLFSGIIIFVILALVFVVVFIVNGGGK